MFRSNMYRVAVVRNDNVLYVAEVIGTEARKEVLKDMKANWDGVEIVEKDLGKTKLAPTGKNYESRGKYTQNTKRAQIERETPVLMFLK